MTTTRLSAEQAKAASARESVVRVEAYAGTGKTTMCRAFASARPRSKFLYLVFNKSLRESAEGRFPANTRIATVHSLAYRSHGWQYRHKLKGNLRLSEVLEAIGKRDHSLLYALRVRETLEQYLIAPCPTFDLRLVGLSDDPAQRSTAERSLDPLEVLRDAERLWARMCDTHSDVPMLHDGYLKLYALSRPRLAFDSIILDEAQDANPLMLDILAHQRAQVLYVGDPHQSIYRFRGAINALGSVQASGVYRLTQSYRFGPTLAGLATSVLRMTEPGAPPLVGLGRDGRLGDVNTRYPYAVLTRANASIIRFAHQAIRKGYKVGFVGGIQGYQLELTHDVHRLLTGAEKPRDPLVRSFRNYEGLKAFATATDDRVLLARCRVAEHYEKNLPWVLTGIRRNTLEGEQAPVMLGTTHKAKGVEFDQVHMGNDFLDPTQEDFRCRLDDHPVDAQAQEEMNLFYVGVTRARQTLNAPAELLRLVRERALRSSGPAQTAGQASAVSELATG